MIDFLANALDWFVKAVGGVGVCLVALIVLGLLCMIAWLQEERNRHGRK